MLRLLVRLVVVLAALPAAVSAEDRPLRLITFNLYHGSPWAAFTGDDGDLEARLTMMIEALRVLDPDVLALQEVPVTRRHGDLAARLAGALGMEHVHARATERLFRLPQVGRLITRGLGFVAGPAVLSRYPILASEVHDLPRCRRRLDPRVALRADIETPGGVLAVFSTHTSRDDCQTLAVAELARARPVPSVVMGDLNTVEDAEGFAPFRERDFVDLYRTANPGSPGPTVWQRIHEPSPTVARRVDYILLRPGPGVSTDVVDSRVVLDRPGRRPDGRVLWPSDHYGVLAEVRLAPVRDASARGR
jgi:endonuclease/exonuclease/phosphatase family metal-dependent hydrolase